MVNLSLHELCKLSGVTRKALLIYEEKGLLAPVERDEGEYRYYDEEAIARLYEILAFKAMGFKLSEVSQLLDDPDYDRRRRIEEQIEEMERQKEELDMLIGYAKMVAFTGILPIPRVEGDVYPLAQYLSEYVAEANFDKRLEEINRKYVEGPQPFDEVNRAFEELFALYEEPPESKPVQHKVRAIGKLLSETFDLSYIEEFLSVAKMMMSGGYYGEILREEYPSEAIDFAARAIEICCDRMVKRKEPYKSPVKIKSIFKEDTSDEQ